MHKNKVNLIGRKFGRLLVVAEATNRYGRTHWLCKCNCGNRIIVSGKLMLSGNTRSCGCLKKEYLKGKAHDLTGKRFGRLIVQRRNGQSKLGAYRWLCRCVCGKSMSVLGASLKQGKTISCGCYRNEQVIKAVGGSKNWNYNPTLTAEERTFRRILQHTKEKIWRSFVFQRDGFTCQICKDLKKYELRAHHLDAWHWAKDKRFELSNGVTLCVDCHNLFHKQYYNHNNTKKQFTEFANKQNRKAVSV